MSIIRFEQLSLSLGIFKMSAAQLSGGKTRRLLREVGDR